ncbi:MAG: hypothetical protein PHD78_01240 [Bacilli bacterium]|nr:hypothetical protein [Bacilli bacterium]MDD4053402.1 hypothetical protein [Bacilli bacterium]MDD4410951.1 hypothetical protein [Bacilli bacterium]
MNELLKAKYYSLIKQPDFNQYEKIGKILALIENQIIKSDNSISKEELVKLAEPLKELEGDVYIEIIKDINNGLIYGGSKND